MIRTAASDLLQDGTTHLSGVDEAILKNLEAVKSFAAVTATSFGPNGQKKLIVNHLNKLFCSSDAGTIIRELEVEHPAAKLVVMAAKMQEDEVGDGTNLIVLLCGELMLKAESLIIQGLHPPDIIKGFNMAGAQVLKLLEGMTAHQVESISNLEQATYAIKSVLAAKQLGYEDFLANLVAQACISTLSKNKKVFVPDNVRVVKVIGAAVFDSQVVPGMVIQRGTENDVKKIENAKIACFSCAIDAVKTETKGTVLIESGDQLREFSIGEERLIEQAIKSLADAGVNVIVSGSTFGDLAIHFMNRFNMMPIKVLSKFELRRVAKMCNAHIKIKLETPKPEEIGACSLVEEREVGSSTVIAFSHDEEASRVATLLIRGSTMNLMDDIERAINDGVNTFRQLVRDGRMVAGSGACEIELARQLGTQAEKTPGLEQYGMRAFSEALEVIPRTIAENAGHRALDTISKLYAAHESGNVYQGVDIEQEGGLVNSKEVGILDVLTTKMNAVRLTLETINTLLRVDQIIMARPAGGPKARGPGARDAD